MNAAEAAESVFQFVATTHSVPICKKRRARLNLEDEIAAPAVSQDESTARRARLRVSRSNLSFVSMAGFAGASPAEFGVKSRPLPPAPEYVCPAKWNTSTLGSACKTLSTVALPCISSSGLTNQEATLTASFSASG